MSNDIYNVLMAYIAQFPVNITRILLFHSGVGRLAILPPRLIECPNAFEEVGLFWPFAFKQPLKIEVDLHMQCTLIMRTL